MHRQNDFTPTSGEWGSIHFSKNVEKSIFAHQKNCRKKRRNHLLHKMIERIYRELTTRKVMFRITYLRSRGFID
jgi:hypothetical protein